MGLSSKSMGFLWRLGSRGLLDNVGRDNKKIVPRSGEY